LKYKVRTKNGHLKVTICLDVNGAGDEASGEMSELK
jgi:hypothetical protein